MVERGRQYNILTLGIKCHLFFQFFKQIWLIQERYWFLMLNSSTHVFKEDLEHWFIWPEHKWPLLDGPANFETSMLPLDKTKIRHICIANLSYHTVCRPVPVPLNIYMEERLTSTAWPLQVWCTDIHLNFIYIHFKFIYWTDEVTGLFFNVMWMFWLQYS